MSSGSMGPTSERISNYMQLIQICYPTLAIAAVYVFWQGYFRSQLSRLRLLHERVAFMLWVSAGRLGSQSEGKACHRHKMHSMPFDPEGSMS